MIISFYDDNKRVLQGSWMSDEGFAYISFWCYYCCCYIWCCYSYYFWCYYCCCSYFWCCYSTASDATTAAVTFDAVQLILLQQMLLLPLLLLLLLLNISLRWFRYLPPSPDWCSSQDIYIQLLPPFCGLVGGLVGGLVSGLVGNRNSSPQPWPT